MSAGSSESDSVTHVCDPSACETEAGKLYIQGQPRLHSKTLVSKINRRECGGDGRVEEQSMKLLRK